MSHIGILPSEPDNDALSLRKWRAKQAYARQLEAQAAEQRLAKAQEKQQRLAERDIPSGVTAGAPAGRMPIDAVRSRLEELGAQSRALAEGLSRQRFGGGGESDVSSGSNGAGFGRVRELGPSHTIVSSPSPSPSPPAVAAAEPLNARERARQIASGISALMPPPPPSSSAAPFDRERERERERDRDRDRDGYDRRSSVDSDRYSDAAHHRRLSDDAAPPPRRPLTDDYPQPRRVAPDYRELDRRERERAEGVAAPDDRRYDGGLERTLVRPSAAAAPPPLRDDDRDRDYPPSRPARSDLDLRDRDRDAPSRERDRDRDRYEQDRLRERDRDRDRDRDRERPRERDRNYDRYDDRAARNDVRSDDQRDNYRRRNESPPPQQQQQPSHSRPAAATSPHSTAATAVAAGPASFVRPAHTNWTSPSGVFDSASASAARAAAQAQQKRAYAEALRAQVAEKEAQRAALAEQKRARQEAEKEELLRAAAEQAKVGATQPAQDASQQQQQPSSQRDRDRDDRDRRDGQRSGRGTNEYDDRDRDRERDHDRDRDGPRSPPRRSDRDRRDRDDRDGRDDRDRRRADSPVSPVHRSSPRRADRDRERDRDRGGRSARDDDDDYDERDRSRAQPRSGGGRRDSSPPDSRDRDRDRDRRRTGGGDLLAAAYADADRTDLSSARAPIVPLLRGLNERSHLGSNLVASSATDEGAAARAHVVARALEHDLPAQQSENVRRAKARMARAREEEAAEELRVRQEQADLALRAEKERERESGGHPSPLPIDVFPPGRSATKAARPPQPAGRRDSYEPSRYDDEHGQAEDEHSARSRGGNGGGSSYRDRDRERDRELDNAASYNYRSSSSAPRPLGAHRPSGGLTESTVGLLHLAADAQHRIEATAAALDARALAAARNRHHVQDESEEIGQSAYWRGGVGAPSHAHAHPVDRGYASGLAGPESSASPHARGGSVYESAMRTPPRSPGGGGGGGSRASGGYRSQQSQQPVRGSTRNPMEQSLRGSSDFQRVDESSAFYRRTAGSLASPSRSSFAHEAPLAEAAEFLPAEDDDAEPLLLGSPSASPGRRGVPQLKTKSQFVYPSGKISTELRPATALVDTRSSSGTGRSGAASGFSGAGRSSIAEEEPDMASTEVVQRALHMHSPSAAAAPMGGGLASPSRAQHHSQSHAQTGSRPQSAAASQAHLFSTTFGSGGGSGGSRPGSSAELRSPSTATGSASPAAPTSAVSPTAAVPTLTSSSTPPHPARSVGSSARNLAVPGSYAGVASSYHGSMHRILTPSGSFSGDSGGGGGGDGGTGEEDSADGGLLMSPSAMRRAAVNSSVHLAAPTELRDLYASQSFLDESVQLESPSPVAGSSAAKRTPTQPSPRTRVQPQVTLKPRLAEEHEH